MEEGEERVRGGREMGEGRGGKKGRRGRDGLLVCSKAFLCTIVMQKPKNKKNGGLRKRLLPICIYTQLLV